MAHALQCEQELEGYTRDLSMLFQKFDEQGSLRFEDFCEVWREMNFSFIHCGQKTKNDKIQSTERLLRCITGYLNPETTFQFRIAAIYAAYSVYYTQLARPRVKIRMTVAMWKDLKDLHELVKQHQHLDINYIINKLENDKAFHYTAMPKVIEYGRKELMANMHTYGSEINTARQFYQPDQYVEELVQGFDVIEKVSCVDDEYKAVKDEIKKSLGNNVESRILTSLGVINEDFRSGLVDDIEDFREWLEANTRAQALFDGSQRPVAKTLKLERRNDATTTEEAPSQNDKIKTLSRSERIKALKDKSFRQGAKESETCVDESSSKQKKKSKSQTFYRRSAFMEKLEARPWRSSWRSHTAKKNTPNNADAQLSTADENISLEN